MRLAITKVDQCLEQWNAHTLLMAVQTWSWKPAVSTKANHVPTRLGLRVAGLGTELDKNKEGPGIWLVKPSSLGYSTPSVWGFL